MRFKLIPAVHLFLIKDNQVLLSRRFNTGYEDGKYSVPAGHLNGNEPAKAAMVREAKEETNIVVNQKDLRLIHVMHRRNPQEERIDFFFVAKIWKGTPIINETNKCDNLHWFPTNKLPKNLIPYIKLAITNFRNNVIFSEVGWN